jgi:hypothetical protein
MPDEIPSTKAPHQLIDHFGGWRPQPRDHRDFLYHLQEQILTASELSAKGGIPYDEAAGPWNQGDEGSCTAHGALGIFVTEAIRQSVKLPDPPPGGAPLSRQAEYYWTRAREGSQGQDAGATVRDAIKTLADVGAAPESDWPYEQSNMFRRPPKKVQDEAKLHMAIRYQLLKPNAGGAPMRTALSRGLGIAFGFPVPEHFEDGSWDPASGEPLALPAPGEGFIGGHCVWTRWWDFTEKFSSGPAGSFRTPPFFTCRNHWVNPDGSWWGMNGEFNIDFRWFDYARGLADDLWVVQGVS